MRRPAAPQAPGIRFRPVLCRVAFDEVAMRTAEKQRQELETTQELTAAVAGTLERITPGEGPTQVMCAAKIQRLPKKLP